MVKILFYHRKSWTIEGTFISTIDLYQNLKNFIDVEFILVTEDIGETVRMLKSNKLDHFLDNIIFEEEVECDTLICSFSTLIGNNIKLNCNKIIALDSLDYTKIRYGLIEKPKYKFILLGNPNNINYPIENVIESYEYYHKFDFIRVSGLKLSELYFYNRRRKDKIHCGNNIYIENIGKLIFENLYLGNTVFYRKNGLVDEDGLCYYLKLFGIDPFVDHVPLRISKYDIVDKLSFKKDDLILKVIGD
jgi:hypothetical protein